MPTGEIEPRQAERLREMGAWLAKYGKTVYGTRGGPFKPGKFGVSTRKDKTIYVHIMAWEGDKVTLPAIPAKIVASSALTGGTVTVKQTDAGIEISLPVGDRQDIATVIALELDKPAMEIPAK
jgi:alpha-L-fucosidase